MADFAVAAIGGRRIVTLRDAASFITKLPKRDHDAPEWQAAIEALMLVADLGGPTMFARIGVLRALNRHHEQRAKPRRKRVRAYSMSDEKRSGLVTL